MNENRRRTFSNALERWREFISTDEFQTASLIDLSGLIEMVEKDYAEFVREHQTLVENLPEEEFMAQDNYFLQISRIYRKTLLAFRNKIKILQLQDWLQHANLSEDASIKDERSERERELESEQEAAEMIPWAAERAESLVIVPDERAPSSDPNDMRWENQERSNYIQKSISCHFCGSNHRVYDCGVLLRMPLRTRCEKIRDRGLCFSCLMPLHNRGNFHRCEAKNCRNCGPNEYHNSMLCPRVSFRK